MLELRQISKYYRSGMLQRQGRPALRELSLRVPRGASVGLAGSSGSGKTTAARMILRLEAPDQGSILFEGRDIRQLQGDSLRAYRRRVQIIYQNPTTSLNPSKKLGVSIAEPLAIHRLGSRAERQERLQAVIRQVGIGPDLLSRYPHQISGGEAQRAMIARALILEPELLVLDEPTSMLDVSVQAQILQLLKQLQRDRGLTYLMISHDPDVLRWFCDSITILHQGDTVEQGPTEEVFSHPASPVTRSLLAARLSPED